MWPLLATLLPPLGLILLPDSRQLPREDGDTREGPRLGRRRLGLRWPQKGQHALLQGPRLQHREPGLGPQQSLCQGSHIRTEPRELITSVGPRAICHQPSIAAAPARDAPSQARLQDGRSDLGPASLQSYRASILVLSAQTFARHRP